MNKKLVRAFAITLIAAQFAGCVKPAQIAAGIPGLEAYALNPNDDPNKGEMTADQTAEAQTARAVFMSADGADIGFNQPEYQSRLAAFRASRAQFDQAGMNFTREQFLALSSSLSSLLQYVDLIEANSPSVAKEQSYRTPDVANQYVIRPGEIAEFSFNGFCTKSNLQKPAIGEPMQLLPVEKLWSEPYAGQYKRIMAAAPAKEPGGTSLYPGGLPDHQVAIWYLRYMEQDNMTKQLSDALSPSQRQILISAGVSPTDITRAAISANIADAATSVAGDYVSSTLGSALGSYTGSTDVRSAVATASDLARTVGIEPSQIMSSQALLRNPADLAAALNNWATSPDKTISGVTPDRLDQYSLLAPGVAAKTLSQGKLAGVTQITNTSGNAFTFVPDNYIANARSELSQSAAPARIGMNRKGPAFNVIKGAGDAQARADLMADLAGLAKSRGLDFLTSNENLLGGVAKMFKSPFVKEIVTSIPVIGNALNLGMLLTGTNLDGTPMDDSDYLSAAVGVIPVVGNMVKAGTMTGKVLSKLDAMSTPIEVAIEMSQTTTAQQAIADSPQWVRSAVDEISLRAAG